MDSLFKKRKEKLEPIDISKINSDKKKKNPKQIVEEPMITKGNNKKEKQILNFSKEDFDFTDFDESIQNINKLGNILHRACLDQQVKQIEDVLIEMKNRNIEISEYINKLDKFALTPILLSCIKNKLEFEKYTKRYYCIKSLISCGANSHLPNPRTLWSCVHWCAHYGDYEALKLLIDNNNHCFLPDYNGQYPIDLAGHCKHDVVVNLLLQHCIPLVVKYEEYSNDQLNGMDEWYNYIKYQIKPEHEKHLKNPIFRCKLLFWNSQYRHNYQYKDFFKPHMNRYYFLVPFENENCRTGLHAACMYGNLPFIKDMFNQLENYQYDNKRVIAIKSPTLSDNAVFSMTKEEEGIYTDQIKSEILKFANWELKFQTEREQYRRNRQIKYKNEKQTVNHLFIDYKDRFGNSPLHLASLKGYENIVDYLLIQGSDMDIENDELFKARELTQHEKVQAIYEDKLKSFYKPRILSQLNETVKNTLLQILQKTELEEKIIVGRLSDRIHDSSYASIVQQLNVYAQKLFVPDFIIRCKLGEDSIDQVTKNISPYFFELAQQDDNSLARLNFQISLLQSAKFQIYLMKSYFEKGVHYIMLQHKESELEEQADLMNFQVKLMDSYDLEEFQKKFQDIFEPFRSRQRQQIIENHLRRIINLNELIRAKIVNTYYRMHKSGGISKIRHIWIDSTKWYLPQPLNQMQDYLSEGQNQNFYSITILRLYFGEKISFFFAWKSYITCALMALAIPGLCIQLYIFATGNYFPSILPWWVCYVCLWSTIQVEFWKRKTYEITTRWGCLDLMQQQQKDKQIRVGFTGYEEIYEVTGTLTKHQKKSETILKLCLSAFVLSFFLILCILIIVGVNYLVDNFSQENFYLTIGLNICQGVGVFVLNICYTYVANKFAIYENHKFQDDYETSLVYKNSAFKFINSYLSIFYAIFYKQGSSFESIFQLLLPVLIVKQVNYVFFKVLVPQYLYRIQEYQYFKAQSQNVKLQDQLNKSGFEDTIELIYRTVFQSLPKQKKINSIKRAVIKVGSSDEPPELETNIDTDQIELNNLKLDFDGTLDYFMEGIIDMGYITLFAAAFPIGPAIAVFANIVEIRMKILSFIEVYKRPECERCAGIGEWLNVMDYLGIVSVFTNFAILFVKQKSETVDALFSYSGGNSEVIIWLYFFTIAFILFLKYFFAWIIPDTPEWVINELERLKEKENINTGQRELLRKAQNEMCEQEEVYEKSRITNEKDKQTYKQKKQNMIEDINRLLDQISRIEKQEETESKLLLQDEELLNNLTNFKLGQNDKLRIGVLRQRYIEIEHILLMKRLKQIDTGRLRAMFVCQNCQQVEAVFDCEECEQNYCSQCFYQEHQKQNHEVMLLKPLKFYNPAIVQNMKVKRSSLKYKRLNKAINFQINIDDCAPTRDRWQKLQNFCLPIVRQSKDYPCLHKFYKLILEEYTQMFKEDCVDISKVYRFVRNEQNKLNIGQSNIINEIMDIEQLNVEEKLWLNRLAYLSIKKKQTFESFYNNCKILQDGTLIKKIQLLIDLADIDDDGYIERNEIEQMFITSMVQDTQIEGKIKQVVGQVFLQETLSKQEAFDLICNSVKNDDKIRQFMQALVQNEN